MPRYDFRPSNGFFNVITTSLPAKRSKSASFFQRTVETRRRHFKPLVIDIFDRQNVLELTRDFLAVFDRNAGRLVNINTQTAASGALEIDELVAESHDRGFNQFRQLHSAL